MARYRTRTRIREHLPWWLVRAGVAPKGKRDCGDHDWYRAAGHEALCYHCEPGRRALAPGERLGRA